MKFKNRILLVSPISEYKSYILPHWLSYVKSLFRSYNSGDTFLNVLLCDNSQNKAFHKQLSRKYGINIIHVDPLFKNSRQFICESRNRLLDHFLNHNYNYMLSLECDVFPAPNFLTKLLAHKKQVVGLPYFIGEGINSEPMVQMLDTFKVPPLEIRNICQDELFYSTGKLLKVFNGGLGCCLIKRKVFENIRFRSDDNINLHDDSFFAEDIYLQGISYWLDTSDICRHFNKPWNYFPQNKL